MANIFRFLSSFQNAPGVGQDPPYDSYAHAVPYIRFYWGSPSLAGAWSANDPTGIYTIDASLLQWSYTGATGGYAPPSSLMDPTVYPELYFTDKTTGLPWVRDEFGTDYYQVNIGNTTALDIYIDWMKSVMAAAGEQGMSFDNGRWQNAFDYTIAEEFSTAAEWQAMFTAALQRISAGIRPTYKWGFNMGTVTDMTLFSTNIKYVDFAFYENMIGNPYGWDTVASDAVGPTTSVTVSLSSTYGIGTMNGYTTAILLDDGSYLNTSVTGQSGANLTINPGIPAGRTAQTGAMVVRRLSYWQSGSFGPSYDILHRQQACVTQAYSPAAFHACYHMGAPYPLPRTYPVESDFNFAYAMFLMGAGYGSTIGIRGSTLALWYFPAMDYDLGWPMEVAQNPETYLYTREFQNYNVTLDARTYPFTGTFEAK